MPPLYTQQIRIALLGLTLGLVVGLGFSAYIVAYKPSRSHPSLSQVNNQALALTNFRQQAKLMASDGQETGYPGDFFAVSLAINKDTVIFGYAVAIDGEIVVVDAPDDDNDLGAVMSFKNRATAGLIIRRSPS